MCKFPQLSQKDLFIFWYQNPNKVHLLHLPNIIWIKPNLSIWVTSTRDHTFNTWAHRTGCHLSTSMGCRSGPSSVPLLKQWKGQLLAHRKEAVQKPEDRNAGAGLSWTHHPLGCVSQIRGWKGGDFYKHRTTILLICAGEGAGKGSRWGSQ